MYRLYGLLLLSMVVGCATPLSHYQSTAPELKLEEFYNGQLRAYGIVQSRSGKVLRRFKVDMTGSWEGNKGVLDEYFYYDDGEQQRRTWYLEKKSAGIYSGKASDVTQAADGYIAGFTLNWKYTLALNIDDEVWNIDFNDWMYLIDENRIINRAEMSKWGFKVGEVTLYIEKLP